MCRISGDPDRSPTTISCGINCSQAGSAGPGTRTSHAVVRIQALPPQAYRRAVTGIWSVALHNLVGFKLNEILTYKGYYSLFPQSKNRNFSVRCRPGPGRKWDQSTPKLSGKSDSGHPPLSFPCPTTVAGRFFGPVVNAGRANP